MKYILDANVFIQAKNSYYAFGICPGFWDALLHHCDEGIVRSIDQVKQELLVGRDDLAGWVKATVPVDFFAPTDTESVVTSYREIMRWVQAHPQYYPVAKAQFAAKADGWIVAYAQVNKLIVVTHEQPSPAAKNRVPIPNVCDEFQVAYVDTFHMLEDLKARFVWDSA